jgi:glycosyltransferase involved in cell wall biosynthesis
MSAPGPAVSVVVPVVERYGDLARLYAEIAAELDRLGKSAEFIFVVDYRQREAITSLRQIQSAARHDVELVLLGGTFGESASLTVGLERARGELLVTFAAYFQVDPTGLEGALQEIEAGADMVVGRRFPRVDSRFNRLQSRLFHWLLNWTTRTRFQDISCGFRVMRREAARELQIYGGLHRFIPILAMQRGLEVRELPLPQRREDAVTRYYGLAVYLKRFIDILTVFFLTRFTHRPLRFFGLLGFGIGVSGFALTAYLGIYRLLGLGSIANRPLLLLGVLLLVLGIQLLSLGLIGEIIIFTHARKAATYRIAEIFQQSQSADRAQGTSEPASAAEQYES